MTVYKATPYEIFLVHPMIVNKMKSDYHVKGRQNCSKFGSGGCSVEQFNSA
jgi:hypothetical protein